MKIAILHPCLDAQGGAERQVLMLAIGLKKRGHDVVVYVSKMDKEKCYPELIKNVRVVECGGYGYKDIKKMVFLSPYFMNKMAKMVGGCDIINCHNYPSTYAAAKIKKKKSIPVIWMCNEPPFPPLYKGSEKNYSLFSIFYRMIMLPFLVYNKIVSRNIDKIIVLDNMNYKRIKNTYKTESSVVHTGLDFPAVGKIKKKNGRFVVLAVGRVDKGKRTEDAIQSIAYLKDKIPNILLNVVGGGKLLEDMKKLAEEKRLGEYVVFHGKVSDEKLSEMYANCDIFLFTAENQSWGLVPLEAMTYKKPCIVSTGTGVADVLEHNNNCLKIKPRDVKGIAESVLELYNNKKLAGRIAENGLKFVRREFSWDKYADEMEKVFLSLKMPLKKKRNMTYSKNILRNSMEFLGT